MGSISSSSRLLRLGLAPILLLALSGCSVAGGSSADGAAARPSAPGARAAHPFPCGPTGGTGGAAAATRRSLRQVAVENHETDGFDRVTFDLDGAAQWSVVAQDQPLFNVAGTGAQVTLKGSAALLVTFNNTTGAAVDSAADNVTGYAALKESRRLGELPGNALQWALGTTAYPCTRFSGGQDSTHGYQLQIDIATR
ncbi:MAG: AMIN-like domain-containing (lipo)protein [Candidatus Dormibacteria bacterium]